MQNSSHSSRDCITKNTFIIVYSRDNTWSKTINDWILQKHICNHTLDRVMKDSTVST